MEIVKNKITLYEKDDIIEMWCERQSFLRNRRLCLFAYIKENRVQRKKMSAPSLNHKRYLPFTTKKWLKAEILALNHLKFHMGVYCNVLNFDMLPSR